DDGDQADALLRRGERLALALHVAAAEERLDRLRAGRRRAQAGVAHRRRKLLVVERPPRGLHGRQEGPLRETPRPPGPLGDRLALRHALDSAGGEAWRQLLGGFVRDVVGRRSGSLRCTDLTPLAR